jgi:hypothetical protein
MTHADFFAYLAKQPRTPERDALLVSMLLGTYVDAAGVFRHEDQQTADGAIIASVREEFLTAPPYVPPPIPKAYKHLVPTFSDENMPFAINPNQAE